MKLDISIHEYVPHQGLELEWSESNILKAELFDKYVKITGNKDGLVDFALHLLTLAQDNVPKGCHIHYDKWNRLENESTIEIVIQKL
jgi:hypothetical protein